MAVSATIKTITPEMAKDMLEGNVGNFRREDRSRVSKYTKDMLANRWCVTGDSIKVNGSKLLDGQHRLLACIAANKSFTTVVVDGVDVNSVKNIDRGRPRTVGQWLRHLGIKNYNGAAAIARASVAYDRGLWAHRSWGSEAFTDSEIIEYAVDNAESIVDAYRMTSANMCIPRSILATVMHLGTLDNPSDDATAVWFVESLKTGTDLQESDAVLHLRNRFHSAKKELSKPTLFFVRQIITKAWNMTVAGESCRSHSTLRLRFTGPAKSKPITDILVSGVDCE